MHILSRLIVFHRMSYYCQASYETVSYIFRKIAACVCCLCVYVCATTVKYYSHTSSETSSAFDQIVNYMTAVAGLVVSYSQTTCLVAADTTLQWTFFSVVSKYSQTRLLKGLDLLQLLTILAVFKMFNPGTFLPIFSSTCKIWWGVCSDISV